MKIPHGLVAILILSIFFLACWDTSEFYDLKDGYKYGYYDSRKTLNVYYNDQGIVNGICSEVRWNDSFLVIKARLYSHGEISNEEEYFLLNKQHYSIHPQQMESDAVTGPITYDSLQTILKNRNIFFPDNQIVQISVDK